MNSGHRIFPDGAQVSFILLSLHSSPHLNTSAAPCIYLQYEAEHTGLSFYAYLPATLTRLILNSLKIRDYIIHICVSST